MEKKLLDANFLESLNLIDDKLVSYMDTDTTSRNIYNGKNKIGLTLIALLLFGFNLLLPIIISYGIQGGLGESAVPIPDINFLPVWLSLFLLLVWVTIWILINLKKYDAVQINFRMVNIHNYVIYLFLELNLFFLTFLLKPLTILGVSVLLGVIIYIGWIIATSKRRALKKLLFDVEVKDSNIDSFIRKTLKLCIKFGSVIVILVIIWKIIFPNTTGVGTDLVGLVGIVAMWLAADIVFIIAEVYLFLPYLLYGYYKAKYPEDYREWEGKSQLEWYGEKYFNKSIKGTEKEKE